MYLVKWKIGIPFEFKMFERDSSQSNRVSKDRTHTVNLIFFFYSAPRKSCQKRQWDAVEGTRKAAPLHTLLFPEIHVSILISFLFIFLQAHSMLHIWRFIWLCLSALKTKWTCNDSVRVRLNYVSMEAKHRSNKIYYSSDRIDSVSDFSGYLSINNAKYDELYFPFFASLAKISNHDSKISIFL